MRSGFVAGETLLHQIIDCLLISTAFHVDEITYDQTSNIAQPKLAGDFITSMLAGQEPKENQNQSMKTSFSALHSIAAKTPRPQCRPAPSAIGPLIANFHRIRI